MIETIYIARHGEPTHCTMCYAADVQVISGFRLNWVTSEWYVPR